jgi:beta-galactosidase
MDSFAVKDGHYWLNDDPVLIQAGEFHYFRTPRDQWRHRLGLLKAAGFNAVASYIPWLWHQTAEDQSDFDGHSHPMRDLAGFLDLAAEMDFLIIARPGPYIMAETINEGIPPWVFERYPQVTFISQDQKAQNVVSYLHPDFLACVARWYDSVFDVLTPRQIGHGGKIIMVQLDNEMGMIQWVRNIFDINPDTLGKFAAYLQEKYAEHLVERFSSAVKDQPALVEFLREELCHPTQTYAQRVVEDYRRFYRVYLREYTKTLWSMARANGLVVPAVLNIHGFANGGKTFPIGISQLIDAMSLEGMVSATDVYPLFIGEGNFHQLLLVNELTKAVHNREQALFSIEFQAGGVNDFSNGQISFFDLHTRLCVSSGMRAINHYLFCDGENDPVLSPVKRHDWGHAVRKDGSLRKHYFRYPILSSVLHSYAGALVRSQPEAITTIGFILDYFMTEVNNQFTLQPTKIITHQRETILFDLIGRGLALTQRAFNALELSRDVPDPVKNPTLWVMIEQQCDAHIQQKLVDYVLQGGKLILVGRMCIEDLSHQPCTILKDGIEIQNIRTDDPFESTLIHVFHYEDIPVSFVQSYSGQFDEIFARRNHDEVVGFVKSLGAGKVMMLGAAFTANTVDDLDVVHQMALKMDCPAPFSLSDWADIRLSRNDTGGFLFINNYQDDPIETAISYRGLKLFDGERIIIPARRGLILPLDWQINPAILVHYLTSEVLEITEENGLITLKMAQERFSAELSLSGYRCIQPVDAMLTHANRVRITGREGVLILEKEMG